MATHKERDTNGRYLSPTVRMADTGSVVHTVKGQVSYGRIAGQKDFNGRSPSRNPMVSGNASRKR